MTSLRLHINKDFNYILEICGTKAIYLQTAHLWYKEQCSIFTLTVTAKNKENKRRLHYSVQNNAGIYLLNLEKFKNYIELKQATVNIFVI